MDESEFFTGGLLRLPKFLKAIIESIQSEQYRRDPENDPSLLQKDVKTEHVIYSVLIGIALMIGRFILKNRILPYLLKNRVRSTKLIGKLTEDLYYTAYYLIAALYFYFGVSRNVHWSWSLLSNSSNVVKDLLTEYPPSMNKWETWYYIQAFGFYLSATIFLILFDGRRSDFVQYLVHHFVTLSMIVMSYLYGYVRTGMVILFLHDIGDIFLYSSKFFHHLKVDGVDIFLFFIFVITFYVSRLVMYSRIVYGITVETLQVLINDPPFNDWALYYDTYLVHYPFFAVALCTLLLLHCFWYTLVLKLIGNELFYGKKITEQGDIRSDDEDDEPLEQFERDE